MSDSLHYVPRFFSVELLVFVLFLRPCLSTLVLHLFFWDLILLALNSHLPVLVAQAMYVDNTILKFTELEV